MSKLLINEPPLQVLPSLAEAIGLNEAIVIQQLHYWLENPKVGFEKNGFKWVSNTYDEWQKNFPFWSTSTIKRIFTELEDRKFVVSGKFEVSDWSQRKAYRVNYELLDEVNLTQSNGSKLSTLNRNTETTTEKDMIDAILENEKKSQPEKLAQIAFEEALGFGSLPWETRKDWQKFSKWVKKIHQADSQIWKTYADWRKGDGKYHAMSNNKIRQDPQSFMDTGYPTFLASIAMQSTPNESRTSLLRTL